MSKTTTSGTPAASSPRAENPRPTIEPERRLAGLRRSLSGLVGWLADRRIPGPLRRPAYHTYCRVTGADADEAELDLEHYPSLSAFFVRRLRPDARPLDEDAAALLAPCDGRVQAAGHITAGELLQAKGRAYAADELLAGLDGSRNLDGGVTWTLYLSPRDYHRVHAPLDVRLRRVAWVPGDRLSVAPDVLRRRAGVLTSNERAILELEAHDTVFYLVMVGALNVGRIRVVGVPPGTTPPPDDPPSFARGSELARFEMGSTVVLLFPPGFVEPKLITEGASVRLGQRLGHLTGDATG